MTYETSGNNGILYIDIRLKREGIGSGQDIVFYDLSGKQIAYFLLPANTAPLSLNGINTTTTAWNKQATGWFYFRMILNFGTQKIQAYIGDTLADLAAFSSNVETYNFVSDQATNFYKIVMADQGLNKGTISFDDFKVYSVSGIATPSALVSLVGKANIGAELTGSYVYSEPSNDEDEGASIGYWQIADNAAFTNPTKIGNDFAVVSGEEYKYTILPVDSKKFVRFCVVPKSSSGAVGPATPSEPTGKIDAVAYSLSTTGSVNGTNTKFIYKNYSNLNTYKSKVAVTNSTTEAKKVVLITAWYDSSMNFIQAFSDEFTVPAGSDAENGIVSEVYTNTNGKTFANAVDIENKIMKVFLFDKLTTIKPLLSPYVLTN